MEAPTECLRSAFLDLPCNQAAGRASALDTVQSKGGSSSGASSPVRAVLPKASTSSPLRYQRQLIADTSVDLQGVLVFHVFGAIAQFERALIRERTAAGLAEARRRGRKGGRPPAFKAGDVTAARALMKEGKLSVRDVAKRMGVSVATLYRHVGKRGARDDTADAAVAHG